VVEMVNKLAPAARERIQVEGDGFEGIEIIVGAHPRSAVRPNDECGSGGILVELVKDVGCRLLPVGRGCAPE